MEKHRLGAPIPVPYEPGKSLDLEVLDNYLDTSLSQTIAALISNRLSMTMSPVMEVTIKTESGSEIRAVLKLYDRRYGKDLRMLEDNASKPCRYGDDAIFEHFVRQGDMGRLLQELEEEKKDAVLEIIPEEYLNGTPEGRAKYEAALWRESNSSFDNETLAYARLKGLQGISIPRLYAHVRLSLLSSGTPSDLLQQPELAQFWEVKGILLELIPGYRLRDVHTSPLAPSNPNLWHGIVQSAVEIAHEINKREIIIGDCQPRNVMVDERSQSPFFIDLAQCSFKDKLVKVWKETKLWGEEDPEDWQLDEEYWERVTDHDNTGAIGSVMTSILREEKQFKLDIKYPDAYKILKDIRKEHSNHCGGNDDEQWLLDIAKESN